MNRNMMEVWMNKCTYINIVSWNTSISTYPLDQNILLHLWHLHFYVSTGPKYSCASSKPQFLRSHPWHLYFYISIQSKNIFSHLWHLHFYVSTQPKYSIASSTPQYLRIYLTEIFYRILNTSISLYLLDQNEQSHPWQLNFFVSTRPKYSIASSTPQFLCIYLTRIFYRILNISISSYLLNRSILLHPRQLHFFVSTRPEYSFACSTPPFLRTYSTRIFYRTLETSISLYLPNKIFFRIPDIIITTYLLDQNIPLHPWQLHFYVSTRPEYSIHPWHLHLFVLSRPKYSYQVDQNILSHPDCFWQHQDDDEQGE